MLLRDGLLVLCDDVKLMIVYMCMCLHSYVIAAISPAVVVPTTLSLQARGYGQASGIPTLIVAAASMDVVISISLFGVFLGLSFSKGMCA